VGELFGDGAEFEDLVHGFTVHYLA